MATITMFSAFSQLSKYIGMHFVLALMLLLQILPSFAKEVVLSGAISLDHSFVIASGFFTLFVLFYGCLLFGIYLLSNCDSQPWFQRGQGGTGAKRSSSDFTSNRGIFLTPSGGGKEDCGDILGPAYQSFSVSSSTLVHICNFLAFLSLALTLRRVATNKWRSIISLVYIYANTLPIVGACEALVDAVSVLCDRTTFASLSYRVPSRYTIFLRRIWERISSWFCSPPNINFLELPAADIIGGDFQSLSSAKERISYMRENWKELYQSDVLYRVRQLVGFLIGYALHYSNPGQPLDTPAVFAQLGVEAHRTTPMTLIDCVLTTTELVLSKCEAFTMSGDYRDLFGQSKELRKLEATIADIEGNMAALELGSFDSTPFETSEQVMAVIEEVIQELRGRQIGEHNRSVRQWYDIKLAKTQEMYVRLIKSLSSNSMREAPFAVLLYGASSVGKSSLANQLMKCLLQACGYASTAHHTTVLNLADKYQSDYRPQHSGIILDDIANAKADKSTVNHTQLVIDLINNIPKAALQAEAEKKGLVMLTPKIVIGTTNVKDIQASVFSNEPFSIVRRFAYTLTVNVDPRYANKDGTLDSSKVPAGSAVDVWEIKVEKAVGATIGGKRLYRYEPVLSGNFVTVAAFLRDQARAHATRQRNLVASNVALYDEDLCEHMMFANLCQECMPVEYQSGIVSGCSSLALIVWFVDLVPWRFLNFLLWSNLGLISSFLLYGSILSVLIPFLNSNFVLLIFSFIFVGFCQLAAMALARSYLVGTALGFLRLRQFLQRQKKPLFVFSVSILAVLSTLRILRTFCGSYQAVSEGSVPVKDSVPREDYWKKVVKIPLPVSESSRTTSFQDLQRMCSRAVRVACVSETEFTHIFPMCGDVWVMNHHVWPKNSEILTMRIIRGPVEENANIQTLVLQRGDAVFRPDLDLIFFRFRSAGSVKDFRPWLLESFRAQATERLCGRVVSRNANGQSQKHDFVNTISPPVYRVGHAKYTTVVAGCLPGGSFSGMCGSPWLADTSTPCILGIHFAGREAQGACIALTRDVVDDAVRLLQDRTTGVMLQSSGTMPSQNCGVEFGPFSEAHPKSPTQFLSSEAKLDYFGAHSLPRRTFRSKVVPSLISQDVERLFGRSNIHGPPSDMNHYRHFQRHLEAVTHTNSYFSAKHLKQAEDDLMKLVDNICDDNAEDLKRVVPLDESSILSGVCGVRGVDRLDQSTSAGWPLNAPKESWIRSIAPATSTCNEVLELAPAIREEVSRIEACALKGERSYAIFRANLKDEPTKRTKDKVRVFAGAPLAHSYLIRKYFLMIVVFIQTFPERFECAVGTDAYGPDWHRLMSHLRRFGKDRGIAGDYKAYDTTISITMLASVYKVIMRIMERANDLNGAFSSDDLLVARSLVTDLCQPCYEHNGDILGVVGSNPSGHNLTVIVNNLANSLYMRYAYFVEADYCGISEPKPFQEEVALLCYGDDNIMGVSQNCPWFNHTSVSEVLATSGVTYTMADKDAESVPYVDLDQLTFLKRGARWEDALQVYLAPLEIDSIFKSLHNRVLNRGSCSAREHSGAAISSAATEFFLHGRPTYEDALPKLRELVSIHDLSNQVADLVSFDERLSLYVDKYQC